MLEKVYAKVRVIKKVGSEIFNIWLNVYTLAGISVCTDQDLGQVRQCTIGMWCYFSLSTAMSVQIHPQTVAESS